MTPFILVTLLAEVLAVSGQASWGVSIVHNGQPQQVYYVNTDSNPYGSYFPFFFLTSPSNGVPDVAQPPPGVEINPEAEVFDPSVKPSLPGSGRGLRRRQVGQKFKRHVKGYDQPKPQERKPLPPLAHDQPEEPEPVPEPPMNASYAFEYSADGHSRTEKSDENGNIEGSYTFVGDDGVERRVDYKAGAEIGFVPSGAHLPVPPVPDYSGSPAVNQNGIKGGIKPSVSSHTPATKIPVVPKVPQVYPEIATHTPTYGVKSPVAPPAQPGIKGKSGPSGEGCDDEGKSDGPMDASYDFSYTNDDSERKEKSDPNGNVEGSYWFIGDDGVRREIKYTAGAGKGFVVTGDIYPTGSASGDKGAVPKTKGYPAQRPVNIPGPSVKNVPQVPTYPAPVPRVPSVKRPVTPAYPQPTPDYGVKTKTPSRPLPPQQPIPEPGTKSETPGCDDGDNGEPGDASYDFSYKTDDHEHTAKSDANGNVQGSYSFVGPDGVLRRVDYVAGADTGFVATGDHLPKPGDYPAIDEGRRSDLPPSHQAPVNPQNPLPPQAPLPLPPQRPVQPHTPLPLPPQKPVHPQTPLPLPPQRPVHPKNPLPLPPQRPVQPHTPLPLPPQKPIQPHTPLPLPPQKPVRPHTPLPLPPQKPVEPQTPLPLPPQEPLPPQTPLIPEIPQEPINPLPLDPQVPLEPSYPSPPQIPILPHIPSHHVPSLVPQVPVYPIPLVPQGPLPDYPQRPIHIPDFPSIPVDGEIPVNQQPVLPPVESDEGQTPVDLPRQKPDCEPENRDYDENSPADRSYSFDFAFDDQARKESSDSEGNVQGTYSFTDPDGVERRVEYEAGPGIGFVARGDHLPKPVEPLPVAPAESVPPRSHGVANREPLEPEFEEEFGNDPADSSYSFTYSTDSHSREAADPHGNAKGTFMFVGDDGIEKKVDYQADRLAAHQVYGAHLPEEFRKAIMESGITPPPFISRYIFNSGSQNDGHFDEDFKNFPSFSSPSSDAEEVDTPIPTAAPLTAKSALKKPSYETFNKRGNMPLKSVSQTGSSKGGYSFSYSSDDKTNKETSDNFEKFKNNFSLVHDDGFEENDGFEKNFGSGYRRLNAKKTDDKGSKAPVAAALTSDGKSSSEGKEDGKPSKHDSYDPFSSSFFPPNTVSDGSPSEALPPSGPSPISPFLLPPRENFYMPNAMSFANRLYRKAQSKQNESSR